MLAAWSEGSSPRAASPESQRVVALRTPTVVTASKRHETQGRRNQRHGDTAVAPRTNPVPPQQLVQQPVPPTAAVVMNPTDPLGGIGGVLSNEELVLREAAATQARLRFVALEGDVETIDLLLRGSTVGRRPRPPVPPDVASDDGWTPLMFACLQGHYHAAQLLVSRGARVNATNALDDTALTLSAAASDGAEFPEESARVAVATLLLTAGADVDAANRMGMTALHRAALHGFKAVARVLLKHGARPELLCRHGLSAVDRASIGSEVRETIVKAQLKRGRRRVARTHAEDGRPRLLQSFGSIHNLRTDGGLESQLNCQPSVGTAWASLSDQVIDRHCSFSGTPSWQRVESIGSRLQEIAQSHGAAPREKRRIGSASMRLCKLNLSTGAESSGRSGHGGEHGFHVVAEGKHILSLGELKQLQACSYVSVSSQF